jgi:hypothetical protein
MLGTWQRDHEVGLYQLRVSKYCRANAEQSSGDYNFGPKATFRCYAPSVKNRDIPVFETSAQFIVLRARRTMRLDRFIFLLIPRIFQLAYPRQLAILRHLMG